MDEGPSLISHRSLHARKAQFCGFCKRKHVIKFVQASCPSSCPSSRLRVDGTGSQALTRQPADGLKGGVTSP